MHAEETRPFQTRRGGGAGGEQRRAAAPRPRSPRGARLAAGRAPLVSAFLAAASCRCLCRAPPLRPPPRGPGASGPVPAGHQVRDAGGDPSTFPSAGRRVTQGSAPRHALPPAGRAVATHLTSWSQAKGARRLPLGTGGRGDQETPSVSRSCRRPRAAHLWPDHALLQRELWAGDPPRPPSAARTSSRLPREAPSRGSLLRPSLLPPAPVGCLSL